MMIVNKGGGSAAGQAPRSSIRHFPPGGGRRAAGETRHLRLLRATLFAPVLAIGAVAAVIGLAAGALAAGCVLVASTCMRLAIGHREEEREDIAPFRQRRERDLEREVFDLRASADVIPFHRRSNTGPRLVASSCKFDHNTGGGDAA